MKKTLTFLIITASFLTSFSQAGMPDRHVALPRNAGGIPAGSIAKQHPSTQNSYTFYMDYDYADEVYWTPPFYARQKWRMNNSYTGADSAFKNVTVAFDSMVDPYTFIAYPNNIINTIKIDSIWLRIGHENNSGGASSIAVSIVELTAAGYPASTVLWSDMLTTPVGLSPGNNWQNDTIIAFAPLFTDSIQHFGVKVEYFGSVQDTFAFVAGYPVFTSSCDTSALLARKSNYFPNSFAYFTALGMQFPTPFGTTVYYDCDTSGFYTPGTDGENFIENINLWCKVEITTTTAGIGDDNGGAPSLAGNFPNPFSGITTVEFSLTGSSTVTLEIFDLSGKTVVSENRGEFPAGKNKMVFDASSLASGMYFYSVNTVFGKATGKMCVLKK